MNREAGTPTEQQNYTLWSWKPRDQGFYWIGKKLGDSKAGKFGYKQGMAIQNSSINLKMEGKPIILSSRCLRNRV